MTLRFSHWTAVPIIVVVALIAIVVGRTAEEERASAPPPDASGGTSCHGYRDRPPTAAQRPYADDSPFNQPLTTRTVHPQSDEIVANALARGVGSFYTEQEPDKEYGHPVYYARRDDPTVTLRTGSAELDGARIPVPAAARPAAGGDGHLSIVTPDCWEYDLWHARRDGATIEADNGFRQRYDGLGVVTPAMRERDDTIGGTTASYFGQHAGVIRGPELLDGRIDHALFLVIEWGSADTSFGYGTLPPNANGVGGDGSAVYPAYNGDAVAPGVRAPMGARFFLDMTDEEIEATGAPAWEQTIAKAMAKYGGYFGDTGGPGFAFMAEPGFQYTTMGLANPFETLARSIGLPKDPVWGYLFRFGDRIPWSTRLKVTVPPTP